MRNKNRGWLEKIKLVLIFTGLALCLVSGAIPSAPCHAQQWLVKPEKVLPKHYPDGFNGYGRIDAIDRNLVVIDDAAYKLSPYVECNTPERANASMTHFRPGVIAGVVTNAQNEVISLWLIE